jgi:hypothetical protein
MSRRRTLKNAVNARTDTEPKATRKKKKKKNKFYPFIRGLDKNQTTLPRLPISAKQEEEEEKNPAKKIVLLLQNTITFQQHSLSVAPSVRLVPPSLPMFFIVNFVM